MDGWMAVATPLEELEHIAPQQSIHGGVGCCIHISVWFHSPSCSCQSMTCEVKYWERWQLIVWRLQREILLKLLVFG